MRRKRYFRSWLLAPPLSGKLAIACSLTAIAAPTLIRHAFDGEVMGVDCIPYAPFILIAAILMSWRYATFVAVGSALACDYLFMGPNQLFESETDWFAMSILFIYSVIVIALAEAVRRMIATYPRRVSANDESSGIIFSLENGQAWASWSGGDAPIPLGPCDEVAEMMEDFLAQVELGKRLTAKVAAQR